VSNTLLTPTIISNELLRRFKNNLSFAKGSSHEYDDKFDKIGDTYNLRVPTKFVATKAAALTTQDVTETSTPLVVNVQAHAGFAFTSKDLTTTIDKFGDRYLNSAAVALANVFDADGLTMAYQATANHVGTVGTTPSTLLVYKQALAKLDKQACPFDGNRSIVMDSDAETSIVDALKGLFQSSEEIGAQYRKGRMGKALGADWSVDQNVQTHTAGTQGGTPLVNGATQTGTSLVTDGWTAAAAGRLKKGDVITLAGVYDVNPVSGAVLSNLKQFVITADVSSDGSGNLTASIYPGITTSGAFKTCSASPADNAAIVVMSGTTAQLGVQNLAYHKEAFCYAMIPLEVPQGVHFASRSIDKETGLSIRIVSQYAIATDVFSTRCDILYGWAAKRPEWSCRIAG
jgi:hypothetical protein